MDSTGKHKGGTSLLLNEQSVLRLPALPLEQKGFLPETSGLYFVSAIATERRLLYVGQTQNFRQRFESHHRFRDFYIAALAGTRVYIAWFELLAPEEFLLREERELIWALRPVLNDQSFRQILPTVHTLPLQADRFTRNEALQHFGISLPTFRKWCSAHDIPTFKEFYVAEDIEKLQQVRTAMANNMRWDDYLASIGRKGTVVDSIESNLENVDSIEFTESGESDE